VALGVGESALAEIERRKSPIDQQALRIDFRCLQQGVLSVLQLTGGPVELRQRDAGVE